MIEEVQKYIEKEELIQAGDTVLVGISGGADSVCLMLVLKELQNRIPFQLFGVHVEHGIRGEESISDATFVVDLCEKIDIPCKVYSVNVPDYAKKNGLGEEEAARILRYESYRNAVEAYKEVAQTACENQKIHVALAHHGEDNAETILFQMVRGSGLDGLCGMMPKRTFLPEADIIRPLLGCSRAQIETYLREQDQLFCTDSTNLDMDYSRNRIRHQILPELVGVNNQAIAHINQSAEVLRELKDYLDAQVQEIFSEACVREDGAVKVSGQKIEPIPMILQKELVHKVLAEVAGSAKDITALHVEAVRALFSQQVGKRVSLPYEMEAVRSYEGISVEKVALSQQKPDEEQKFELCLTAEELETFLDGKMHIYEVPGGEICFKTHTFQGKMEEIPKNTYTKWLNYDKIKCGLQIRNRKNGDYLTLDEAGHTKRLKEYFINEKVPAKERDEILLLTQESHIVWVIGGRISADFKIEDGTVHILEVQIHGGKYHEDQEN